MNDLTLITVTLFDRGFTRYWLSFTDKGEQQQGAVVWAKGSEDVRNRALAMGYRNVVVSELPRDRFWAEKRQGPGFIGAESKQMVYRVETVGDWIVWPEYVEVSQ